MTEQHLDISDLWKKYKETGDKSYRDLLILHYSPLVKFVAMRVFAGMPSFVDPTDLTSYGVFGLIDAIEKFDPERNFKFETYAMSRIRGSIIDELRSIDWVPRSVRTKMRELDEAYAKLENDLGRTPTEKEVARHLKITESELQSIFKSISAVGVLALDESFGADGRVGSSLKDSLMNSQEESPMNVVEKRDTKKLLVDAISKLPDRERKVLTLYYFETMSLAQVGEVLGVTESRACQIHAKAILSLRRVLQNFI